MHPLRRASVAGRWYPDDRNQLGAEVDRYVARADIDPRPPAVLAIVAPHAGLMYSGPVAAFAYKAAAALVFRAIVLVGPSHFVPFHGVSLWSSGAWETPFGPVSVNEGLASALFGESEDIIELAAAHSREHSLEMQLPFVARLMPGASIVPLVMGHQTRETAVALGDAIARTLSSGGAFDPASASGVSSGESPSAGSEPPASVLLVASSDLSHYEDANTAAALDGVVVRHVEALDPDGLMDALERDPRHACGGGPMVSVLRAARQLGATRSRVLHYADSGDVSGDKSSVVGYMAAAIW